MHFVIKNIDDAILIDTYYNDKLFQKDSDNIGFGGDGELYEIEIDEKQQKKEKLGKEII
jgi:hypothetical protein